MIYISKELYLQPILASDTKVLYLLMQEIYPPVYGYLWEDNGDWYLNSQYSKENILKELSDKNAEYYFVVYQNEIIGNFRFVWDEKLSNLVVEKQVKLHRIYLHPKNHGKGIGKKLIDWLEQKVKEKNYKIIWLDAMDVQKQAFEFYKILGYQYYSHVFLPFDLMHNAVKKMNQLYKELL